MKCMICESRICLVVCNETIICMVCLKDIFEEYMKSKKGEIK